MPKKQLQNLILELQENSTTLTEQSLKRFKEHLKDEEAYEALVIFLSICQTNEKKIRTTMIKLIFILLETVPEKQSTSKAPSKNDTSSTKTFKTPFGNFSLGMIIGGVLLFVVLLLTIIYFTFFLFRVDPHAARETFDSLDKITTHVINREKESNK